MRLIEVLERGQCAVARAWCIRYRDCSSISAPHVIEPDDSLLTRVEKVGVLAVFYDVLEDAESKFLYLLFGTGHHGNVGRHDGATDRVAVRVPAVKAHWRFGVEFAKRYPRCEFRFR